MRQLGLGPRSSAKGMNRGGSGVTQVEAGAHVSRERGFSDPQALRSGPNTTEAEMDSIVFSVAPARALGQPLRFVLPVGPVWNDPHILSSSGTKLPVHLSGEHFVSACSTSDAEMSNVHGSGKCGLDPSISGPDLSAAKPEACAWHTACLRWL
jgi:hypothetical protein